MIRISILISYSTFIRCIHPPSIFTYGPFLRRGRSGSAPFFIGGRLLLTISINKSPYWRYSFCIRGVSPLPYIVSYYRWREMSDITSDGLWFNTLLRLFFYILSLGEVLYSYTISRVGLFRPWLYTSAVYLYLRSIFTAGAAGGSAFTVLLSLFISLWIMNSERFQVYVLHYNLSRDHPLDLIGIRLPWGLDPRGVIYTSAVHLYLRSILTAGAVGVGFYGLVTLFISLWIMNSERFWYHISILIVYNLDGYSF
jgi:hypothetical protein